MPKNSLTIHLDALRRELADTSALDAQTRELLIEVAEDIDEALGANEPDYASLRTRIETAALKFEAEHPRFAGILSHLTDTLAKLGI